MYFGAQTMAMASGIIIWYAYCVWRSTLDRKLVWVGCVCKGNKSLYWSPSLYFIWTTKRDTNKVDSRKSLGARSISAGERSRLNLIGPRPGGHSAHIHNGGGVSSRKFHCNPKISAYFILWHLKLNIKYLEAMQIEVTNTSSKPRNIILTIFDAEKYQEK